MMFVFNELESGNEIKRVSLYACQSNTYFKCDGKGANKFFIALDQFMSVGYKV
jgi:hypothetical protein